MKKIAFTRFFLSMPVRMLAFIAFMAPVFLTTGSAQVNHVNINTTYTQGFNNLPLNGSSNFISNTTLTGWYVADASGNNTIPVVAGTGSSGAVNLYSFGAANSNERSLGSVGTNSNEYAWGLRMKNNTGQAVQSVSVSFVGEQWRRASDPEEHIVSFSYKVSNAPITSFTTSESGYSKTPFLNFISPQFSSAAAVALDGNQASNRYTLTLRFNVSIPNGHEIMFKWFDRNDPDYDHGLAIDDVAVRFFTSTVSTDQYTGTMPLAQFMKGFLFDIPDEGSGVTFNEPTANQLTTWGNAVSQVLNGQYSSARTNLASNSIGYRITSFAQAAEGNLPARTYYILSKDGLGANHWGTYVFSPNALKYCVNFQAPHPMHDDTTGEQATYLFRNLDAYHLAVAGAHRCLEPDVVACTGSSGPCRNDGDNVISDHAHNTESVFQKTTEIIAAARPSARFLQMHGFGSMNDTMLVISNGTKITPVSNDRAYELGEDLEAVTNWKYTSPHLYLSLNKYLGLTNVQGRLLNNYQQDICDGGSNPSLVTGRFLHIEQAPLVRTRAHWTTMKNALAANNICSCPLVITRSSENADETMRVIPSENLVQIRYGSNGVSAYVQSNQPEITLVVANAVGQIVWSKTLPIAGEAYVQLPTELLPNGVYVLHASEAGTSGKAVKFVVSKG